MNKLREKYKDDRFWEEIWDLGEYAQAKELEGDNLTIIDIGCLSGEFGWWMYDRAKIIYAIEPHLPSYNELINNVTEYDKDFKFRCFNQALSDYNGEGKLTIKGRGGHALSLEGSDFETVKVQTLESFMNNHGIDKVDIIKFDVEGAEDRIFSGFDSIASRIRFLIGEVHDDPRLDFLTKKFQNNEFEVEFHKGTIITALNTKWE